MIEQAMASRKKLDLEQAIEMGEQSGICEAVLKGPREALANEERRIAARQSASVSSRRNVALTKLSDSVAQFRQHESPQTIAQKIKSLRHALQSAKAAGLE